MSKRCSFIDLYDFGGEREREREIEK